MFQEKNNMKTTKEQLKQTDRDKKDFTDAFNDCSDRLKLNHYYLFDNYNCETLSRRASIVSKDMYTFMVSLFDNMSKHLDADVVNYYTDIESYADSDTDTDLTVIDDINNQKEITKNYLKKYSTVDHCYSKLNNKIKNKIKDSEDDTDNESSTLSSIKEEKNLSIFDELPDCDEPTRVVDEKPKKKPIVVHNIYARQYSHQVNKKSRKIRKRKKDLPKKDTVTFKEKVKIVKLMYDNPGMKLEEIKKLSGCNELENFSQIYKWAHHVENQGSQRCIMEVINESVYEKYNANKNIINKKNIDDLLHKWGIEEKKRFYPNRDVNFKASNDWVKNFKRVNKIHIDPPKQLTKKVDMVLRVKRLREEEEDNDDGDDNVSIINERKKIVPYKKHARISFEDKQKVIKLATENPDWSSYKLMKMSGVDCLINEIKIEQWTKDIEKGGSLVDKYKFLNDWVLSKFDGHRKNMIPVSFTMVKDWGQEGRIELKIPKLKQNDRTWVHRFISKNQIFGDDDDLQRNV